MTAKADDCKAVGRLCQTHGSTQTSDGLVESRLYASRRDEDELKTLRQTQVLSGLLTVSVPYHKL